jgi:hypothetical protein
MGMVAENSPRQKSPPNHILEFVAAFMRSLNAGRLYATSHELYKTNIQELFNKFREALQDRQSLFLGCAKDALFFEGIFYQARDTHLNHFLNSFHSLGISHLIMDKDVSLEDLDSFVALLAGTHQNQENELSYALRQENVQHVSLGMLDYRVFSTAQALAARFAPAGDDEAFWQQLILQPATAGVVTLSPEKMNELARMLEDTEGLRRLLGQIDRDMREIHHGISAAQRGMMISNFLLNLEKSAGEMEAEKRVLFARRVGTIISSFELELRIQILGAIPPESPNDHVKGAVCQIIQAMPDKETVYLLLDALQLSGVKSPCFTNLLKRAIDKYREPGILLGLVRAEMQLATQERRPGSLNQWQHLEQLILERQEIEEFNAQYSEKIEALAQSILIDHPLLKKNEMDRLASTLSPDSLRIAKTRLVLDLIHELRTEKQKEIFLEPLMKALKEIVVQWSEEGKTKSVGSVLRHVFLILQALPKDAPVRKSVQSWLTKEEIQGTLKDLFGQCSTFDSKEMASISAICQIFAEKTTGFLLDRLVALETENTPQALWLATALASMGPNLIKPLSQRLRGAPEKALPQLISIAEISMDVQLARALQDLLDHKDLQIRTLVVSALAHLKAESAVPRLAQIVQEKSWFGGRKHRSFQMHTARALAEIGSPKARAVLREVAGQGSGELEELCQQLL